MSLICNGMVYLLTDTDSEYYSLKRINGKYFIGLGTVIYIYMCLTLDDNIKMQWLLYCILVIYYHILNNYNSLTQCTNC